MKILGWLLVAFLIAHFVRMQRIHYNLYMDAAANREGDEFVSEIS